MKGFLFLFLFLFPVVYPFNSNSPVASLPRSAELFRRVVLLRVAEDFEDGAMPVPLKRGQGVLLTVQSFGYLGGNVDVHLLESDSANDVGRETLPFEGLLSQAEIQLFRDARGGDDVVVGEQLEGYVLKVRPDNKIDVSLRPVGPEGRQENWNRILLLLQASPDGVLPLGDKSSPEAIRGLLPGLSKRSFKEAVGYGFREGLIQKPDPNELRLGKTESPNGSGTTVTAKPSAGQEGIGVDGESYNKGMRSRTKNNEGLSPDSVMILGLPYKTSEAEVRSLLGGYGEISAVGDMVHPNGRATGRAVVTFTSTSEGRVVEPAVSESMRDLDGTQVGGRTIQVKRWAIAGPTKQKTDSSFRGQGRGQARTAPGGGRDSTQGGRKRSPWGASPEKPENGTNQVRKSRPSLGETMGDERFEEKEDDFMDSLMDDLDLI